MSAIRETKTLAPLVRRHLQFAWWSLLGFVVLGALLEAFHGFKADWYLEPAYQTRRLMWTLAHAHGSLLALVHGLFAVCAFCFTGVTPWGRRWISPALMAASLLLPGGFFLGGVFVYGGDPGLGIFLVPLGAFALVSAVTLMAIEVTRCTDQSDVNQASQQEPNSTRQRRRQ